MDTLYKKALFLSYFTVIYNFIEGVVSIIGGIFIGSISLTGFGMDSFVESLSAFILIWRLRKRGKVSVEQEEDAEHTAIRVIGVTFFILGGYVLFESLKSLYGYESPEHGLIGVVIAVLSIVVMVFVYIEKQKVGRELGSRSVLIDSKQTLACIWMSIVLLLGLGANYFFGIWWTDGVGGIFIAFFLLREGYEAYEEGTLCCENSL